MVRVSYDKLRLARLAKRLTTNQLAARSGVSANHINNVETGKSDLTVTKLCCIAQALNKRPEHLFDCEVIDGGQNHSSIYS